ncbi:DUF262 domain-containing protein [Mycoplasmopsis lipofaciens]|uniref:DUF262 domain-containing protein n=1 Tax=Mycoplasmopsis lipofaciens TaxID=114884 RepID=UPI000692291E|nr:DUF262 domain-containing protein [Mycoplasmopsis lipofaciens]
MQDNIDAKPVSIREMFSLGKYSKFYIPEYQRAYKWENKQCDKLWNDIIDFDINSNDKYFFGTIIINSDNYEKELNLIDGQQRTTTFILLLKALLMNLDIKINKLKNDKNENDEKRAIEKSLERKKESILQLLYKANDNNMVYFLQDFDAMKNTSDVILINKSLSEIYKDDLQKILFAKDLKELDSNITIIKNKRKDNRYTNFYKNFKFFYNKLENKDSTELISFADKFLDNCQILKIKTWNIDQAISMFNSLNSDGLPLEVADILAAELMIYVNNDDNNDFKKKWFEIVELVDELDKEQISNMDSILLQQMYINRSIAKDYSGESYENISTYTPGIRAYYLEQNRDILKQPLQLINNLLHLIKIWHKIKDFTISKLCFKFNQNIKIFMISYLSKFKLEDINEEKVKEIAIPLLKLFTILELVEIGYSSSKFKSFLFKLNLFSVDDNYNVSDINKMVNEHINTTWKREQINQLLNTYSKNVLVYLNEYLISQERNMSLNLNKSNDVEHILPKVIWRANDDKYDDYIDSLGNKIVLERPINRGFSEEWFPFKLEKYKNSIYPMARKIWEDFSIKNSQDSSENKIKWDIDEINNNEKEIIERIMKFIFD